MHTSLRQTMKDWMLPISMMGGIVFYQWMHYLTFLSPYLIFVMLTITYCRIQPRDFRIGRFQWYLLAAQMLIAAVFYFSFLGFSHTVATGVFICVFVPTATAAPVITGMLGGSITRVATYSLVCNLTVAVFGPLILAAIGNHPEMTFLQSFYKICSSVLPLLVLPIVTAMVLRYTCRPVHDYMAHNQSFSFYMWALALFIVVGSSVSFIVNHFSIGDMPTIIGLLLGSLAACAVQFLIGRKVGARFGDKVTGGQCLGQKNTVLAIWLALTYLNQLASVAPAAYVAWHNIANSWQLIHYHRRHKKKVES